MTPASSRRSPSATGTFALSSRPSRRWGEPAQPQPGATKTTLWRIRVRSQDQPRVVVLAGPNGAGKSTAAPRLLKGALGVTEFVNADVIAQGLSAFAPERVAIAAGRLMLARIKELAAQRKTF